MPGVAPFLLLLLIRADVWHKSRFVCAGEFAHAQLDTVAELRVPYNQYIQTSQRKTHRFAVFDDMGLTPNVYRFVTYPDSFLTPATAPLMMRTHPQSR